MSSVAVSTSATEATPGAEPASTGGFMLAALAGFAGLGAEVVYLKALDFSVGAAPLVRLTVVATFIVGMGVGALLSARVRRPWVAEGVAGLWALVWLLGFDTIVQFSGQLVAVLAPSVGTDVAAASVGLAHLIVPTLALGIALPAIIESEGNLGVVYAHHAIGALVGIVVFEAVVYPTFGLPGGWALIVAAHAGVLWLWRQRRRRRPLPTLALGRPAWPLLAAGVATGGTQGAWLLVAALLFRPYYFVAPSVIGAFIFGQTLGALLWARWRHAFGDALRWSAIGCGVSVILGAAWLLADRPATPAATATAIVIIIVPAAIPIGTIYPAWTRTEQRSATGGALLSLSIGNALGLFLGGGLLLSWMSPLNVLVGLAAALAVLDPVTRRRSAPWMAPWIVVGAAALVALRTDDTAFFRGRDGRARRVEALHLVRGPGELSAIYRMATKTDPETRLHQSGYSPVNLDVDRGLRAESTVGALGVLHAPRHERAMVLGAGSGRTAGFVATAFEHTDVIDVGTTVPSLLTILSDDNYGLLDNPGVDYHAIDGVLAPHLFEPASYDLIVHTLHPGYVDRAAKLYTEEYLRALRGLLRDDGVLVTWSDVSLSPEANRIYQTTVGAVFPRASLYAVRPQRWDYSYYVLVAGRHTPVARIDALREPSIANDAAVVELLATPLSERRLPPLTTGGRTHRFDRPAPELLAGGFAVHALSPCRGECSTHDTLKETQPCGPQLTWRRSKNRVCTRECTWGPWSAWSECAP